MPHRAWLLASLPVVLAGQLINANQVLAISTPSSTCATTTRLVYVSDRVMTNVSVCPAATTLPPIISTIYVGDANLTSTTSPLTSSPILVTLPLTNASPTSTPAVNPGLINVGFENGELALFDKLSSRASAEVVDDESTFEAHSGSQYLYGCL